MNTDDKVRRFLEGEKKLFEPKDERMFMLTLRIPQNVIVAFDKLIKERGEASRSEVVRELIKIWVKVMSDE